MTRQSRELCRREGEYQLGVEAQGRVLRGETLKDKWPKEGERSNMVS